jgi:hypothetical protein
LSIQTRNKSKYYYVTIRHKGIERSLYLGTEATAPRWAAFFGQPIPTVPAPVRGYRDRGRNRSESLVRSLAAPGDLTPAPRSKK